MAAETKTWLTAKVGCKLPAAGCQVRLAVIIDEGDEVLVGTHTYDASVLGWHTWTIPLKGLDGDYLQGTKIQYKVYVENTSSDIASTATPEVDSVSVEWKVAPTVRRTWNIRCVTQDAQKRLDGTPNPLTTRDLQEAKLLEYISAGKPVLFWDAEADGSVPAGAGTEVNITDTLSQPFRVDTMDSQVLGQFSMTLEENVTS